MPATYAHYKFGKKVYRALPGELREMIKENKAAYLLGLHGRISYSITILIQKTVSISWA